MNLVKTGYSVWWYDEKVAVLMLNDAPVEFTSHEYLTKLVDDYVEDSHLIFEFRKDNINFYDVRIVNEKHR